MSGSTPGGLALTASCAHLYTSGFQEDLLREKNESD